MSMEYIRRTYGVPAARGAKVVADGQPGVITGSAGQYLRIRLDGDSRSGRYHPTSRMEYVAGAKAEVGWAPKVRA